MKKLILLITIVFVFNITSQAQNTFPSTGNVGIGTTTPAAALDINGDLAIKGTVANSIKSISVTADGTYVVASGSRIKGIYTLTFEAANRAQTVVLLANGAQFDYNSSLSVLSNSSYASAVVMSNFRYAFNSDNSVIYLIFDIGSRNGGTLVTANFNGNGYINPNWGGTLPASPTIAGIYPLVINAGNVSIGTANANGYKLAVNGSAIATSMTVKLNANWPDYVFKPSYQLRPLTELRTYIDLNHHLPDMPSEQEVNKNGINLGEINTLLTKKVEELTLYLVDQQKIEKEQQQKISSQEERISKLERSLEQLLKNK